jgi:hypothetical protein
VAAAYLDESVLVEGLVGLHEKLSVGPKDLDNPAEVGVTRLANHT